MLWLSEVVSLSYNFCLSVTACQVVEVDPSLRDSLYIAWMLTLNFLLKNIKVPTPVLLQLSSIELISPS